MNFSPTGPLTRGHALAGIIAALALLATLSCAPAVREEPAAKASPVRSAEEEARIKEQLAPKVAIAESPLQAQAFKVQDLAVAEERGQTALRVKFSEPVTQYRHFALTQPARIVLDVFGPANQMPEVETFRSE